MALPAERFDASNAELFRFAKGCGLLQARVPAFVCLWPWYSS